MPDRVRYDRSGGRPLTTERPEVSVVVVAFRSAATLPRCLQALADATRGPTELVVVDNAAEPETETLVRAYWPQATVITNSTNLGFAAAVNRGLANARGHAVLLLNPDAIVERGALEKLSEALATLPRAGIVAPRLLDEHGQPALSCYPFPSLGTVAWRHLRLFRLLPNALGGRYRRRALESTSAFTVDWAQGACVLVRRDLLESVGRLDQRFFLYCEEVDLSRRAAAAGWRTYFVPTATVNHAEGSSSGQVVPLKLASHYYSKLLYFDKHHGVTQTTLLRVLLLFDLSLRIVYRLLGRPADARRRIESYVTIAGSLLNSTPSQILERWQELGLRAGQHAANSQTQATTNIPARTEAAVRGPL